MYNNKARSIQFSLLGRNLDRSTLQLTATFTGPTKNLLETIDAIKAFHITYGVQVEVGVVGQLEMDEIFTSVSVQPTEDTLDTPISNFLPRSSLGTRAKSCLHRRGIKTVGDLVKLNEADLRSLEYFGSGTLKLVKNKLASVGLKLATD